MNDSAVQAEVARLLGCHVTLLQGQNAGKSNRFFEFGDLNETFACAPSLFSAWNVSPGYSGSIRKAQGNIGSHMAGDQECCAGNSRARDRRIVQGKADCSLILRPENHQHKAQAICRRCIQPSPMFTAVSPDAYRIVIENKVPQQASPAGLQAAARFPRVCVDHLLLLLLLPHKPTSWLYTLNTLSQPPPRVRLFQG